MRVEAKLGLIIVEAFLFFVELLIRLNVAKNIVSTACKVLATHYELTWQVRDNHLNYFISKESIV